MSALLLVGLLFVNNGNLPKMDCPNAASLDAILNLGSIYIGELHGTQEVPTLVHCLVKRAVERHITPLTVSLELPEEARKGTSEFWAGVDGRSSESMWQLVKYLLPLEASGKLHLNFQEGNGSRSADFDSITGATLRRISARGRLIAYGGNYHALRDAPVGIPSSMKPAGTLVGASVKHVLISSKFGGKAWACLNERPCGPVSIPPSTMSGAEAWTLRDGSQFGYDRAYFVDHYTYSPPHLSQPLAAGAEDHSTGR